MMERPLLTPYLPRHPVKKLLTGNISPVMQQTLLHNFDMQLIQGETLQYVESELNTHPDLFCCMLPDYIAVVAPSQIQLAEKLISDGYHIIFGNKEPQNNYPDDCFYNAIKIGNSLFCFYGTDDAILKNISNEKSMIKTNQGYAKCSVAPVCENAFITDDISLYRAGQAAGYDVLCVSKGDICLPGFSYGFIGGCTGKIAGDCMVFSGNIKRHRNYADIKAFLMNYGIYAESLSGEILTDVGSLIPLTENYNETEM